jgi:hypothetical protein
MPEDLALFGDDHSPGSRATTETSLPIAPWQVDLLRKNLDALGLNDMGARQEAIESAVGRPVESLKSLTHDEAMRAVERLGRATPAGTGSSSWDNREASTWIDRL